MTIKRRIERAESMMPKPRRWRFPVEDFARAYGPPVPGERERLEAMTFDECRKFIEQVYREGAAEPRG